MDLIDHTHPPLAHTLRQYYELTKPRIVMLTAFCAVIGCGLLLVMTATVTSPPSGVMKGSPGGNCLICASCC